MNCPECRAACAIGSSRCASCGLYFDDWVERKWNQTLVPRRRKAPAGKKKGKEVFLAMGFLALSVWAFRASREGPAPALTFVDAAGAQGVLGAGKRPALVVFWAPGDEPSARLLKALSAVRIKFRGDELDMVGFCTGDLSDLQIRQAARTQDWRVSVASARRSPGIARAMSSFFSISAPGREVFILNGNGRLETHELDGAAGTGAELQTEVELALWRALPELRSSVRSGLPGSVPGT